MGMEFQGIEPYRGISRESGFLEEEFPESQNSAVDLLQLDSRFKSTCKRAEL